MATPASSLPDITLPPAIECEAYLRTVRAELCRLTGETFVSVTVLLNGEGTKITWSTYTDGTTHIHTKSPQAGLCAQIEALRSGIYHRITLRSDHSANDRAAISPQLQPYLPPAHAPRR